MTPSFIFIVVIFLALLALVVYGYKTAPDTSKKFTKLITLTPMFSKRGLEYHLFDSGRMLGNLDGPKTITVSNKTQLKIKKLDPVKNEYVGSPISLDVPIASSVSNKFIIFEGGIYEEAYGLDLHFHSEKDCDQELGVAYPFNVVVLITYPNLETSRLQFSKNDYLTTNIPVVEGTKLTLLSVSPVTGEKKLDEVELNRDLINNGQIFVRPYTYFSTF